MTGRKQLTWDLGSGDGLVEKKETEGRPPPPQHTHGVSSKVKVNHTSVLFSFEFKNCSFSRQFSLRYLKTKDSKIHFVKMPFPLCFCHLNNSWQTLNSLFFFLWKTRCWHHVLFFWSQNNLSLKLLDLKAWAYCSYVQLKEVAVHREWYTFLKGEKCTQRYLPSRLGI